MHRARLVAHFRYKMFCAIFVNSFAVFIGCSQRQNTGNRTPLMNEAIKGNLEQSKTLVAQGANVSAKDDRGQRVLTYAVLGRNAAVVDYLITKKANVNAQEKDGYTPLMYAAFADTATVLLKHGADVNAKNIYGETALMLSAEQGHADIVKLLLQYGADARITGINGDTAEALARKNSRIDVTLLSGNSCSPDRL